MVVLRYWHLFHGKPYDLRGEKARKCVLNYYSMLEEASGSHSEERKTLRSRTAPTRQGSSSRMLGMLYNLRDFNSV